ncbi:MAG: discoidin domain-containing protein, partial [Acidobacteriota bacterium]
PVLVTELQFESAVSLQAPGPGRGAPNAAPPTAVVGYPRGYSVQVSTDGKTWSKPVAAGKGGGPRTTITFPPTRAAFVRITQTDTTAGAPAWSVRNLRLYESPSARAGQ